MNKLLGHGVLGEVPFQPELDIRILSLFGVVTRAEENITLQQLMMRQLAMDNKKSWFQQVTKLYQKYDININSAAGAPWRKKTWKQYIKDAVKQHWQMKILDGASTKSSLKRLDTNSLLSGTPHQIWSTCKKIQGWSKQLQQEPGSSQTLIFYKQRSPSSTRVKISANCAIRKQKIQSTSY